MDLGRPSGGNNTALDRAWRELRLTWIQTGLLCLQYRWHAVWMDSKRLQIYITSRLSQLGLATHFDPSLLRSELGCFHLPSASFQRWRIGWYDSRNSLPWHLYSVCRKAALEGPSNSARLRIINSLVPACPEVSLLPFVCVWLRARF